MTTDEVPPLYYQRVQLYWRDWGGGQPYSTVALYGSTTFPTVDEVLDWAGREFHSDEAAEEAQADFLGAIIVGHPWAGKSKR